MTAPFKTQLEIFKHLINGGSVVSLSGTVVKFTEKDELNFQYMFRRPMDWMPYEEPKTEKITIVEYYDDYFTTVDNMEKSMWNKLKLKQKYFIREYEIEIPIRKEQS